MPHQDDAGYPPRPGEALVPRRLPTRPRAAVLVLHGGRETDRRLSRPWQLAALRMHPFLWSLSAELPGQDVLLACVRYRLRGWNGTRADPVADTRRALDRLTELAGPVPTVLVGHSMGARAALRAAGHPRVNAVLALAPWCPPGEPVRQLAGRHLVVLHGERDRVTSPADSAAYVRLARGAGARTGMALVGGGDHAMLRRHGFWHRTAAATVAHLLDPDAPDPLPARCYGPGADSPVL
ncbi:alpha/beta fold hydrolase [Streptomyces sp. NBC_00481]|uniref:alpha/beta fold hydrolase n=1 Tax=Streptomyces sp. NBC_00481 TaxID=2975755 RepID=UPI002DDB7FCD|nr:alpha/beta fold hydrolase [Streptomyces sp. NBC_00481]WRY96930.1 alpha/beta fold hydrolase [Streptomyces sp. NBC_00481]